MLRKKGLEVYEEVNCLAYTEDNSHQNRRADITILDRTKNKLMILDLTLLWETNEDNQEKKSVYEPTIYVF